MSLHPVTSPTQPARNKMHSIHSKISLVFLASLSLSLWSVVASHPSTLLEDKFFRSMRGKLRELGRPSQGTLSLFVASVPLGTCVSPVVLPARTAETHPRRAPFSLWNAMVVEAPVTTHSAHWTDSDGFDCHETLSTSSGTFHFGDSDDEDSSRSRVAEHPDNQEEDAGRGDDTLFRIQKRSDRVRRGGGGGDEDKVPDFVVKDGFFNEIEDPLSA
ncbi:hypothetical protein JCM11491_003949 [Sporobolomyces phaffii]